MNNDYEYYASMLEKLLENPVTEKQWMIMRDLLQGITWKELLQIIDKDTLFRNLDKLL